MVVAVIVVMMMVAVIVVMMVVGVLKIGDRDCGYDGGCDCYEKNLDCLEDA